MIHLHSTIALLVLLFLLFGVIRGATGKGRSEFGAIDKRITLLALIFAHLQLLTGLYLWFTRMSSWDWDLAMIMQTPLMRLIGVEHIITMLIAVTLITVVRIRTKKIAVARKSYRSMLIGYSIAILLVLVRIPWDQWRLWQ